jgi:hypothetical protein
VCQNIFAMVITYHFNCCASVPTSSKLKRTPPIGAPKATETPAADAADSTYKEDVAN